MHLKASSRQRLLLYTALGLYDALVKSVHQGLTALDLPTIEIQTAESRSIMARGKIEQTKDTALIEFTNPMALCLVDALALYSAELEELQQEIKALAVALSEQEDIFAELDSMRSAEGEGEQMAWTARGTHHQRPSAFGPSLEYRTNDAHTTQDSGARLAP